MKRVKINLAYLDRSENASVYQDIDYCVANYYPDLAEAKIVAMWRYNWKRDVDGHLIEGQVRKASAVDREIHKADIIMLLNFDLWNSADFTQQQRLYRIDSLLSRVRVSKDKEDEDKRDENGRLIYRIAKPDFECQFKALRRHGLCSPELMTAGRFFAEVLGRVGTVSD